MISFIYAHHFFITGCEGNSSSFFASGIFKDPNKKPVASSRKIEYSCTPFSFNSSESSGHISSCLFLYSISLPLNNFILNATLSICYSFISDEFNSVFQKFSNKLKVITFRTYKLPLPDMKKNILFQY